MKSSKLPLVKATVLLAFVLIFVSCSKDDETPGLFGTWTSGGAFTYEGYELDYTQSLTLTETSFDLVGFVVHPVFKSKHAILGYKGPLEVIGDSLYFSINEAGFAEINESSFSIGELIYYESGDPEFNDAIDLLDERIPLQAKYEIRENGKLYIIGDTNADGDSDDEYETTEFSK